MEAFPPTWQQPSSYYAAPPSSVDDVSWYLDTSASHHLTTNLGNLYGSMPYSGNDTIQIGNGSGLHILCTGSSTLSSSQRSFSLQDILYVPHICKNLLSVRKFALENNVFF